MPTGNKLGTFFDKEDGKTYEVNEGDITVTNGYSCLNTSKQKFLTFERPVIEENFLEFETGKDLRVKGATSKATHICMYEPEFPAGAIPVSSVSEEDNNGSYLRFVTAYRFKTGEIQLPLKDSNASITAGDSLGVSGYNTGVDKFSGDTNKVCVALESKSANSGGYIIAELNEPYIPFLA